MYSPLSDVPIGGGHSDDLSFTGALRVRSMDMSSSVFDGDDAARPHHFQDDLSFTGALRVRSIDKSSSVFDEDDAARPNHFQHTATAAKAATQTTT